MTCKGGSFEPLETPPPPPSFAPGQGDLKWKRSHFRLTCVGQKRLCLSSLFHAFEISVYFCWSFFGRMKNKVRIVMKYIFMSFIVVWFFVSCWWRCFKRVLMASLSAPRAHTRSVRQEWRARWLPPPVKKWNFLNQGNLEEKGQGVSTTEWTEKLFFKTTMSVVLKKDFKMSRSFCLLSFDQTFCAEKAENTVKFGEYAPPCISPSKHKPPKPVTQKTLR